MESVITSGLLIAAAFALLMGTFLALSFLDERAQKWIALALLIGMAVCWFLQMSIWLVVQAVLLAAVLVRYLTNDRPRVRAGISLLVVVAAGECLVALVGLAIYFPILWILTRAGVDLPDRFYDVLAIPWFVLSAFVAWKLAGRRLLHRARIDLDILRDSTRKTEQPDEVPLVSDS
jgi:hypothetical protein